MPLVAADAYALLGQIAVHEGALDTARDHFQQAVLLLSGVGADRSAASSGSSCAGLLESVGDARGLDAYRRAAAATGLVTSTTRRAAPD